MLNYFLNDDTLVRGSDLRDVIDAINANEVYTDFNTIQATKGNGGTFLSVVDQYGGGGGAGALSENYPFKTTMTLDSESNVYNVSVNAGQVVLPVGQELLPVYEFTNNVDSDVYIYIEISGTQTGNGGWTDYTAEIKEYSTQQVNTDDTNYFMVSFISDNTINQQRFTTFDSGGRIY